MRAWLVAALVASVGLGGCGGHYWKNLPEARPDVLAYHDPDDPKARRATVIARRLTQARPLPVERVYVLSSDFLNRAFGAGKFPDDNAGASAAGRGIRRRAAASTSGTSCSGASPTTPWPASWPTSSATSSAGTSRPVPSAPRSASARRA